MAKPALKSIASDPACHGLITRLAYARARREGVAVDPLLRQAGLTAAAVKDRNTKLAVSAQIQFLELVAAALGDGDLGFNLSRDFELRELALMYYVPASAATLGEGLSHTARYSVIINEGVQLRVSRGKTLRLRIRYQGVARHTDRHQIEFWIGTIIRLGRHLTGRDLEPVRVKIMHRRPEEKFALRTCVRGGVEAGADADEIDFPAESFDVPHLTRDPYLHRLLVQSCEEAMARQKTGISAFRAQVENAIAPLLPHGQARVERVAAELGMSPRTLARRLADENMSFAGLLRELRSALADRYLAESNLPISQIAWLLGYTEIGTFTHAYRRWTGKTPTAARAQKRRPADRTIRKPQRPAIRANP